MLGIGLGGFARGVDAGVGLGKEINKGWEKRSDKLDFDNAMAGGKARYDAAVASGDEEAGDVNGILRHAMPTLMENAKTPEEADKRAKWLEADSTKRATGYFRKGLLAGQSGDMKGALEFFVKAGNVDGYGPDVEIGNIVDLGNGAFSVDLTGEDGKTNTQTFKNANEVATFGAKFLNPIAGYEKWDAAQTKKATNADTDNRAVQTATRKKQGELGAKSQDDITRANLGIGTTATPSNVISATKEARSQLEREDAYNDADDAGKKSLRDQRTKELLDQAGGGGVIGVSNRAKAKQAPPVKLIVDPKTGKPRAGR